MVLHSLVVGLLLAAGVARYRRRACEELLTALSCAAIRAVAAIKMRRAGLAKAAVTMRLPHSRQTVRAHFLERPALAPSPTEDEHALLIVPGFTASAALIMSDLVWKLRPPPSWRVVVMELPLHEANLENFDGSMPGWDDVVQYTVEFAKATGLIGDGDGSPHLHLCGYSLGGRVCMQVLHAHPAHVRKLAMIAPAFGETLDDGFDRRVRSEPRRVHAWRTRAELREVCSLDGMIGCRPGHLLSHGLVQGAMVREREHTYGREHGDFFADYVARLREEVKPSPLDAASLRRLRAPVLLVTGERDRCVASEKCRERIRDVIGPEVCAFHELADTSHYAAPRDAGGWLSDGNILYGAAPLCAGFLFGESRY